MDAWRTSGLLKLAATGKEVKVDFSFSAKAPPRPDWGSRLPTMDADISVLHGQGQSKQLKLANRQVLYLARFGLDIAGVVQLLLLLLLTAQMFNTSTLHHDHHLRYCSVRIVPRHAFAPCKQVT